MEPITTADAAKAAAHQIAAALEIVTEAIKASGRWDGLNALIDLQRLVLQITEQQQALVLEHVELQQKVKELRQRVAELEAEKQFADAVIFEGQAYWRRVPGELASDQEKEGPFCQTCYDKEAKWVRLRPSPKREIKWLCSLCGTPIYHATPPRLKQV